IVTGDPAPFALWHSSQAGGGQNFAGWEHERASQLLEEARLTTNDGLRNDYYYEFQEIFAEEVPAIVLFHPVFAYGVSQDILDVQLGPITKPSDRFQTVTSWRMLTEQVIYEQSQFDDEVKPNFDSP
ncbi:MAG: hypothetical protein R3264_06365, partial [Anaerolineae bacterium]|nr:hypothetical protein [Anaerolineae bacterium]